MDCGKMEEIQVKNFSTGEMLSTNALMEEVKPILMEK